MAAGSVIHCKMLRVTVSKEAGASKSWMHTVIHLSIIQTFICRPGARGNFSVRFRKFPLTFTECVNDFLGNVK